MAIEKSGSGRYTVGRYCADYDVAQQRQLSVKEMATSGDDGHRQILRPRPVHDRAQGHRVILLTMDQQGAGFQSRRYRWQIKTACCRAHQYQMVYRALCSQPVCRCDGYKSAK